jgi:hypothetical protein
MPSIDKSANQFRRGFTRDCQTTATDPGGVTCPAPRSLSEISDPVAGSGPSRRSYAHRAPVDLTMPGPDTTSVPTASESLVRRKARGATVPE